MPSLPSKLGDVNFGSWKFLLLINNISMYIQGGSPTIVVNGVFFSPFFMAFKFSWVDPWGEISPF